MKEKKFCEKHLKYYPAKYDKCYFCVKELNPNIVNHFKPLTLEMKGNK